MEFPKFLSGGEGDQKIQFKLLQKQIWRKKNQNTPTNEYTANKTIFLFSFQSRSG